MIHICQGLKSLQEVYLMSVECKTLFKTYAHIYLGAAETIKINLALAAAQVIYLPNLVSP